LARELPQDILMDIFSLLEIPDLSSCRLRLVRLELRV
jgi:hypothetical protein